MRPAFGIEFGGWCDSRQGIVGDRDPHSSHMGKASRKKGSRRPFELDFYSFVMLLSSRSKVVFFFHDDWVGLNAAPKTCAVFRQGLSDVTD
jgi:hypothetical protein